MAFKKITKQGEEFILNRCISNSTFGNNRFSGKRKFALPKSNIPVGTIFTATPTDEENKIITSPTVLAKNLISWFNRYSELYLLDANIIAAQSYAESGYNLWIYSDGGAMGVTQFLAAAVFDTIIKNEYTFKDDIPEITKGMTLGDDPKDIRYFIPNFSTSDGRYISTIETSNTAKANRGILFQNIINNPKVMIKAQCYLMNTIGQRNNNLASSSLFAYNRGSGLKSNSYEEIIDKTSKRFGKKYIGEGIGYVDRIFKLLAGKEPNIGLGFGYEIDFTTTDMSHLNINESVKISGNIKLSTSQEKEIQKLHPVAQDIFREFISTVEKETPFKIEITSSYRTFTEQEKVRAENKAKTPPLPASEPGSSYHNYGLALDIAIVNKNGIRYSFNKTVSEWKETNVPAIADRLNIRWGGNFNNPDQVHFDIGNRYSISTLKQIAINTYGTNPFDIQGNNIPLTA